MAYKVFELAAILHLDSLLDSLLICLLIAFFIFFALKNGDILFSNEIDKILALKDRELVFYHGHLLVTLVDHLLAVHK